MDTHGISKVSFSDVNPANWPQYGFLAFLGTHPKIAIQNDKKYDCRLTFDDFVHFSILLFDLVRFWQSTIKFFPMKKMQPCFNFFNLGGSVGGKN